MNAMTPPEFANVEAEQQVLGAILTDNDRLHLVADVLEADHFADPVHARIWKICAARIARGHLASPVTLKGVMENDEGLKELGGPRYLARLAAAASSTFAIREYAGIILEDFRRRTISAATKEAQEALAAGGDSLEVLAQLQQRSQGLPEPTGRESSVSMTAAVTSAVRNANDSYQGNSSYLKTGLPALDRIVKGFGPGDLVLLGGATSMGKTATAIAIADNVAMRQREGSEGPRGYGVAFVSLEMEAEELATRMASSRARVPYSSLRDAENLSEKDFRKWVEASQEVSLAAMRTVPKHVRDIPAIYAAVRRSAAELGDLAPLSLVVVDYAQLVRATGANTYEKMREVADGLKSLAKMLEVPVLALVQLSRDIARRDDKRPQLWDIKESGQFENNADFAIFCHREHYWLEREGPEVDKSGKVTPDAQLDHEAALHASRNVLELYVHKNRHGPLGVAKVGFHAPTNRFWDLKDETDGFA